MPRIDFAALADQSVSRPRQRTITDVSGVRVDFRDGMLELYSPYDPGLVDDLKAAIPYTERKWAKERKCWQITPEHADTLHSVVYRALGVDLQMPPSLPGKTLTVETRLLDVRYIGRVKDRNDGSQNAFGWSSGDWSIIFPKAVLLEWFGQADRPEESVTLYGVLGIARTEDVQAIKTAHRRMARQWHPDICSEPDAQEQFLQIQRAYEILSNPAKRQRYNAGLALQASLQEHPQRRHQAEWQPPLRCGLILAEGTERLGRFVIQRLLQWVDIQNDAGEILVSSWPTGADTFEERWVQP